MIWLQKQGANTLKPYCSHWLRWIIKFTEILGWKQTRYNGHCLKGDRVKAPGHLLHPLPKHTPGHSTPTWGPALSSSQTLFQPLGHVSPGTGFPGIWASLDQVPEGKDCDSHIFRSAASSTAPGTWLPLKCLLSTRKVDGRMDGWRTHNPEELMKHTQKTDVPI